MPVTNVSGAYLLVIELDRALELAVRTLGHPKLESGWYLYAGSARGPGGIAARVARHLRGDGRVHWHVDHLVAHATIRSALAWPGGTECALVTRLLEIPGASTPVPRFGSSDCRRCRAHLVRVLSSRAARSLPRNLPPEVVRLGIGSARRSAGRRGPRQGNK